MPGHIQLSPEPRGITPAGRLLPAACPRGCAGAGRQHTSQQMPALLNRGFSAAAGLKSGPDCCSSWKRAGLD